MKWLVLFWRWLISLFDRGAIGIKSAPYSTMVVEDMLPVNLVDRCLYLVEDEGYFEQAAMICPCGCGKTLIMNLLADERPCWKVTQHSDGTTTLYPSVWRKKDCRSHFLFRRGQVIWCQD